MYDVVYADIVYHIPCDMQHLYILDRLSAHRKPFGIWGWLLVGMCVWLHEGLLADAFAVFAIIRCRN